MKHAAVSREGGMLAWVLHILQLVSPELRRTRDECRERALRTVCYVGLPHVHGEMNQVGESQNRITEAGGRKKVICSPQGGC